MKTFDIDKLIPEYKVPFKMWRGATKKDRINAERAAWVHTAGPSYRSGVFSARPPGVKPEKVLNWRALEKRCAELNAKWNEANTKFWGAVMAERAKRRLDDKHDLYIFIEPEWILKCHPDGFSTENATYITDELVKGKRSNAKFAVMKYDEGGAEIGYLNRRSNMLLRCKGVYERILDRALRDRIQLYIDGLRLDGKFRSYYPPQVYIIENEGRVRVAQSDSLGKLSWIEGDVLMTSSYENR